MQRAASGATSLGRAATHTAAEVLQQDEHSAEWRAQRKHFFVLTNAGAPHTAQSLAASLQESVPCPYEGRVFQKWGPAMVTFQSVFG